MPKATPEETPEATPEATSEATLKATSEAAPLAEGGGAAEPAGVLLSIGALSTPAHENRKSLARNESTTREQGVHGFVPRVQMSPSSIPSEAAPLAEGGGAPELDGVLLSIGALSTPVCTRIESRSLETRAARASEALPATSHVNR